MSTSIRDYKKLAHDIFDSVGGKNNIISASRCATRLRIVLKDYTKVPKEKIASFPGVITVVENGGQLQVVIGTNVGKVFEHFGPLVGSLKNEKDTENKGKILNRVIATMSAVFAPFIYVLAAAGILQGFLILSLLVYPDFENMGTYQILNFMSWAPFTFLPIFIAITASSHFKTNLYVSVATCMALVDPSLTQLAKEVASGTSSINFLGMALSPTTYTFSVLPPLFLVWILSYLEKFLEPKINETIKPLAMPFLCYIIMVPLTLILVGPLTAELAHGIAKGYNSLVEFAPILAGAVVGGFWQVFVIFGVHWGITPVVTANFENHGMDSFQAFQTIAVIGQVGAVLGFYFKTKSKELKGISASAFTTGIFGITEPSIYGINLRFKKPFIYGSLGGMIGAMIAALFNSRYFAYAGLPGPLTLINAINKKEYPDFNLSFTGEIIGASIAFLIPIILIQILGTGENKKDNDLKDDTPKVNLDKIELTSPLTGKIIPLKEVEDQAFSEGLMGEGVAIIPKEGKIYAPCDGFIEFFPEESKHAIGILSKEGVEILIHVGIDTVNLKGKYFQPHIKADQEIKKGDLLLEFDISSIEKENFSTVTPVLITNREQFSFMEITNKKDITKNDNLIMLKQ